MQAATRKNKQNTTNKGVISNRVDAWYEKNLRYIFIGCIAITTILGFYLFDIRISEGGDDSGYIEMAKRFLEGVSYPSFHGAFYSIFLSLIMAILGFKIFIFKLTSFLFILGHLCFFFYTFRNQVPAILLAIAMLLTSVTAGVLYYASQTYTEAFYLCMQSAVFFLVLKRYNRIQDHFTLVKDNWRIVLLVGFLAFGLALTRNIGIMVLVTILVYLILEKKYYLGAYTLVAFFIFRIPFNIYKRLAWNLQGSDMNAALDNVLYISYYNPTLGKEDLAGMISRFLENSQIYLSQLLMMASGLKDPSNTETSVIVTILLYILFAIGIYMAFRRNPAMKLIGIYLGLSLSVTFIALQPMNSQMRLIVIYIPLIFLFIPWAVIEFSRKNQIRYLGPLFMLFLCILILKQAGDTSLQGRENRKIFKHYRSGDVYYGFSPDWANFLEMSAWASENVPAESSIASRKPSMSFIYGNGRRFYGIYKFPIMDADTVISRLENEGENYIIIEDKSLKASNIPDEIEFTLKRDLVAYIAKDDSVYVVYDFDKDKKPLYLSLLRQHKLTHGTSLDTLRNNLSGGQRPPLAVVPDSLINRLHRNNVDYLIRGSLRMDPTQKTTRMVNTIYRYMYFIEQKYMGIFTEVHQVGKDDQEPAKLFKINWEDFVSRNDNE